MSVLTIDMVTLKALALYRNANFLLQNVSKKYTAEFARKNAKIGDSLRIRVNSFYTARNTMTASAQATNETYVPLTVDLPVGVDVDFTTTQLALDLNSFGEQVLEPVMNTMASASSLNVMNVINQSQNVVSTNANGVFNDNADDVVAPTVQSLLLAGAYLDLKSAPPRGPNNRIAVLNPLTSANLVNTMSGFFNSANDISRQFKAGEMGLGNLGISLYGADQLIPNVTSGTASTFTLNGATQTGPTLTISALSGTLKKGQYFTLAGVFAANRITGATTGQLMQFVLTADANNGATSLSIAPTMLSAAGGTVAGGNVSNLPGSSAVGTPVTKGSQTTSQNILFDRSAIEIAFVELPVPSGAVSASRKTYDGVSVRCINAYDWTNDINLSRFDVLMGVSMVRPDWCVIIQDLVV